MDMPARYIKKLGEEFVLYLFGKASVSEATRWCGMTTIPLPPVSGQHACNCNCKAQAYLG